MISQCVRAHPNPHFIGRRVCLCYVSKAAFPSPLPPRPNHCGHLVHLLPLGAARARSIPLRARVECRHCIAPWHLWQSRSSFALPLRSVGGRGRSLGRCGTDCDWGHNLQWFFETKLSDASRKPVGRSAVSRLHIPLPPSLPPLCICNDARPGSRRAAKDCVPTHSWRNYNWNQHYHSFPTNLQ